MSDDSGLEIDLLKSEPGIYSSRWSGEKNNFDLAIKKIFEQMSNIKKDWTNDNTARFICCMTLLWPDGKNYSSKGVIRGKISIAKKGKKVIFLTCSSQKNTHIAIKGSKYYE